MLAWKTSSPHPTCLEAEKMIGLCCQIALTYSVSLSPASYHNPKYVINYLWVFFFYPRGDLFLLFILFINKFKLFCFFFSSNEGVWSSEGCVRSGGNMTYSVCLCNHLTNFAILMQVVPLEVWNLDFFLQFSHIDSLYGTDEVQKSVFFANVLGKNTKGEPKRGHWSVDRIYFDKYFGKFITIEAYSSSF